MDLKNVYCCRCKKKLGSNKNNIADKFVFSMSGDLKYIDLFHKKCAVDSVKYDWFAKHNLNLLLGGNYAKK